jgi:putative sigma-54 modulation protein
MQLTLTGRQLEITAALGEYTREKLGKITRHFDQVIDLHVVLSVEKLQHHAEATITASGKKIHAEAVGSDMYAAIDLLVDKLDRQTVKHKERITERGRGEPRAALMP